MLAEDVEVSFEIDDMIMEAAGELILDPITIVFALAWDVIGALNVPAGSEFDLNTTV